MLTTHIAHTGMAMTAREKPTKHIWACPHPHKSMALTESLHEALLQRAIRQRVPAAHPGVSPLRRHSFSRIEPLPATRRLSTAPAPTLQAGLQHAPQHTWLVGRPAARWEAVWTAL
jgi:hypothetical protein